MLPVRRLRQRDHGLSYDGGMQPAVSRNLTSRKREKVFARRSANSCHMPIEFRDKDGVKGWISEALEVEYYGRFNDEIVKFVSGLEEFCGEDRVVDGEDVMTHVLLELPENAPVVEVERPIASR